MCFSYSRTRPKSVPIVMAKLLISFYKVSNESKLLGHIMLLVFSPR